MTTTMSPTADRLRWERMRLRIGTAAQLGGVQRPVGPSVRDLRQILHLTAGMGAGKTQLLANLLQQLLPVGFTLIDGKGDDQGGSLVAFMRRLLPQADEGRFVLLDVLDLHWPLALNPLAHVDLQAPGGADRALGQIRAIFGRIDPATWQRSVGMQQYLDMATLLVLHGEARPTLAQVKQALVDEGYRDRLLATVRNPEVETFWRVTFPQLGEGQKTSRDALLRRFDMLLTAETTRYLLTQAAPSWSLLEAIEGGLIVLIPLPDMALGGMAGVIGTLMFQEFVRAAFGRPGDDQTRATYPLVVDEFQILLAQGATEDVATALTRLRSLGIGGIYAHQLLSQLGELEATMRINAQSRVILQTGEPDASIYARQFAAAGITAADISGQPPRDHQYASLLCHGQPTGLFSLRPLPWPVPEPLVPASAPPSYAWQQQAPPDSPSAAYDRQIMTLAYDRTTDTRLAETLTRELSGAEWQRMQTRWTAIGRYHRQLLLDQPALIPDRLDRQRWLSRLLVARPLIFAEIEYRRQRPAIEATAQRSDGGRGRARMPAAPVHPAVAVATTPTEDGQREGHVWATPDGNAPAVDPQRLVAPVGDDDWQVEGDD
jgi:hypothetical protein